MIIAKGRKMKLVRVAFSPDGRRLLTASAGHTVVVWDAATGTPQATLSAKTYVIRLLLYLSDAEILVGGPGSLERFDLADPRSPVKLPSMNDVSAMKVGPDGQSVILCGRSWVRRRARLADTAHVWEFPLSRERSWATEAAWSADGRRVAVGTYRGETIVLDAATGAEVGTATGPLRSRPERVALSPDGSRVAWVATTRMNVAALGAATVSRLVGRRTFTGIAWHPSGAFLVTTNREGLVDTWDPAGERQGSLDWGVGRLNDVVFDATGDRAACCSHQGHLVIWDVDR